MVSSAEYRVVLNTGEVVTVDPFGDGMGLTVARHALRNLGGEVTVVDRPDGGASSILLHPTEWRTRPHSANG